RNSPERGRLQARPELGLGLSQLPTQVLRVPAPQLSSEDGEGKAAPVRLSADGIPRLDGLVAVGECEREDGGDDEIAGVRRRERAALERGARPSDDLVDRAAALGPLPRRDRGEHPCAGPTVRVDRPVASQALEACAVCVAGAEEERDQLARLEL